MTLSAGLVIPASLALLAALSAPWQPAVAMEATGSISGTVISATTLEPVAGVEVAAVGQISGPGHIDFTTTDSDGRYVATGLAPDSYTVYFAPYRTPFASERYPNAHGGESAGLVDVDGANVPDIDVALDPGGTITGTITSGIDGTAATGASACAIDATGYEYTCQGTDPAGAFVLTGLPIGPYRMRYVPPSGGALLPEYFRNARDLLSAATVTVAEGVELRFIDATLEAAGGDPDGSISGRVTSSATGLPAANVSVSIVSPNDVDHQGWAATAADGTYRVTGLPADEYYVTFRSYYGAFAMERYDDAPGDFWNPAPSTLVPVTSGVETTGIDASLDPGGTITGTVRSGITGQPIPWPRACALDAAGEIALCSLAMEDGTYTIFGAPVGSFRVEFIAPDSSLLGEFYADVHDLDLATEVPVREGQVTRAIDAVLDDANPDTTPPTMSFWSRSPWPTSSGWDRSPVTVYWACRDTGSGPDFQVVSATTLGEGADLELTATCEDNAGNESSATETGINVDWTAPTIGSITQDPPANADGWVSSYTTVTWTCEDTLSGPQGSVLNTLVTSEGGGQNIWLTCTDVAGNWTSGTTTVSLDRTAPALAWVDPITDGATFLFGEVSPAPTCTADDGLSGVGSCAVSGYTTTVGDHTLEAAAQDRAGNRAMLQSTYTVLPWTLVGFRPPVSMTDWNVVRSGSSIPLKFEVFAGSEELTDVSVISAITAEPTTCPSGASARALASAPSVGSLAYDVKAGYFTYTWKAPRTPGACLDLTATTVDGSRLTASIQVK